MTFCSLYGQTSQQRHSSLEGDYYVDGFIVYSKLSKVDSLKLLKDMVSKLNGKWTSIEKIGPKETKFTWTYELNETTFKGYLFNLDMILAAPLVRLQILNGQLKIIHSRSIGETLIDDDVSNIKIIGNELTIGDAVYKRIFDK